MTKKEIVCWLENKKRQKLNEKDAESRQKKREIYKAFLESLGFYEVTGQIQEHLQQALDIWRAWKNAQDVTRLGVGFHGYGGFERQVSWWLETEIPFTEMMEEHDITLPSSLFDDWKQEKNQIFHNINSNYNKVTDAVYAAKNVKEAKAYLENLGFDLSDLEKASETASVEPNVDTSFLFLERGLIPAREKRS